MSAVKPKRPAKLTEKEAILRGVERDPGIHPLWRDAMIAECQRPGRYSAARVARAVVEAIQLARDVAAAEEYTRAIKKGPRGRRPITPIIG
jgi:hypothetical protein